MIGTILIYFAFICSITSLFANLLRLKYSNNKKIEKLSGFLFNAIIMCFSAASIFLLNNILSHDFRFTYVYNNTSKQLPFYLLLSSLFAGQEGSYLLWGLFIGIIALLFRREAKKHNIDALSLSIFSLGLVFIALLLIIKSPFEFIWQTYSAMGVPVGTLPIDGRGLNPVLENIWMAIHPPILFLGYAMIFVLYILSISVLVYQKYEELQQSIRRWTLLAASSLGLGIVLGGFWAYETLGWGGFWGWDPVENASLIPWILCATLLHTLIVERHSLNLARTNFWLSQFSLITMLYAVFVTRSGILSKISVHSFEDSSPFSFYILLAFFVIYLLLSSTIYTLYFKKFPNIKKTLDWRSQDFKIAIGAIVLLFIGIVTFIGTNFPIFSDIVTKNKVGIDISFFNKWNLPLVILMMLVNTYSYIIFYATSQKKQILHYAVRAAIALLITLIAIMNGIIEISQILAIFSSILCIIVSVEVAVRKIKKFNNVMPSIRGIGGSVSHFGLALLMLGIIAGSVFSDGTLLQIRTGEEKTALGYTIKFKGISTGDTSRYDQKSTNIEMSLKKSNATALKDFSIITYLSSFNNWREYFSEPSVIADFPDDLYLTFKGIESEGGSGEIVLEKDSSHVFADDSTVVLEFIGIDNSAMQSASGSEEMSRIPLGAIIRVYSTKGKFKEIIDTLINVIDLNTFESVYKPVAYPEIGCSIAFSSFTPDHDDLSSYKAQFSIIADKPRNQIVTIEIFRKPYIYLVWIGFILIISGFVVAFTKKKKNPTS